MHNSEKLNFFKIDTEKVRSPLFLFAGGGTGGHLMPALATAQAIKEIIPGARCTFVVSQRIKDVFGKKLSGFPTFTAPELRWLGAQSIPSLTLSSAISIERIYRTFAQEKPDVVIGMGGWGCAPAILAAVTRRIPTMIFEANAIPGKAVRLLAPLADKIQLQWNINEKSIPSSKKLLSGTPVRPNLFSASRRLAADRYGFDPDRTTLLVMGGTQGALQLNELMSGALAKLAGKNPKLQVLHITGENHIESFANIDFGKGITYKPLGFEPEMHYAYAAADFAVCRAGGGSIAELTGIGLPAILIPYPHASDGHQLANAKKTSAAGAALIMEQETLSVKKLADTIFSLAGENHVRTKMRNSALTAGRPLAAWHVAQEIVKLSINKDRKNFIAQKKHDDKLKEFTESALCHAKITFQNKSATG